MEIERYLAMTAAELQQISALPPKTAWMACHFSPYSTGLSNLPEALPEGSLLILNDRTPWWGHDAALIAAQLEERITALSCRGLLLDFQRADCPEVNELAFFLSRCLPCPVGVSEGYADAVPGPVFLPPAPLQIPLEQYLSPWKGREIWLELALSCEEVNLTGSGASTTPLPYWALPAGGHRDEALHCHYTIQTHEDCARFTLYRTQEDLDALLAQAQTFGVTTAVGLWQELA